jgi:DNA polymerase I-like protein with 3'-5' exonuclease and polymerase domains
MRLLFDLETNGLLPDVDEVHCACCVVDDGPVLAFHDYPALSPRDGSMADFLDLLERADEVCGHNIQAYDLPVLRHLGLMPPCDPTVFDTLVAARFLYPDVKSLDADGYFPFRPPPSVRFPHSLEAWGHRLGLHKGDFKGPWAELTQDMLDYGMQDVAVTRALRERLDDVLEPSMMEALRVEHEFAALCESVTQHGFRIDEPAAAALEAGLMAERAGLLEKIHDAFPPRTVVRYTPKKRLRRESVEEFNPNSRPQVAQRLRELGWEPMEQTPTGLPKVDDASLERYKDIPQVALLRDYLTVQKRLSQLSEGKGAVLKRVKGGRVHGRVLHNGTITHRCSHSGPNMGQIPAAHHPYGPEFRALFLADEGWLLTGTDASGLELRMLAHYLGDPGFIEAVVSGTKEEGTDAHTRNMKAGGLPDRDTAKTALYAIMYGAGDFKLGKTIGGGPEEGADLRRRIVSAIPGFQKLLTTLASTLVARGMAEWGRGRRGRFLRLKRGAFLIGLDGRPVFIRHAHAVLNTLLQSAGALVMKRASVLAVRGLRDHGLFLETDFAPVALVHDEHQITHRPEPAALVREVGIQGVRQAGLDLGCRCPLDAEATTGLNWKETH